MNKKKPIRTEYLTNPIPVQHTQTQVCTRVHVHVLRLDRLQRSGIDRQIENEGMKEVRRRIEMRGGKEGVLERDLQCKQGNQGRRSDSETHKDKLTLQI